MSRLIAAGCLLITASLAHANIVIPDGDFANEANWSLQAGAFSGGPMVGSFEPTGGNGGKYIRGSWSLAEGSNMAFFAPINIATTWTPADGPIVELIASVDLRSNAPEAWTTLGFLTLQNGHIIGSPITTFTAVNDWQTFTIDLDPATLGSMFGASTSLDFSDTAFPIYFGLFAIGQATGTGEEILTLDVDNISFTAITPEPATMSLLMLSAAVCVRRKS
jgi:hypothetical protein